MPLLPVTIGPEAACALQAGKLPVRTRGVTQVLAAQILDVSTKKYLYADRYEFYEIILLNWRLRHLFISVRDVENYSFGNFQTVKLAIVCKQW